MQYQRREAFAQFKKLFDTDNLEMVKIGDKIIFKIMTPSELDRLATVTKDSCKNYDQKILEISSEFAKMRGCETVRDYCNYMEFTIKYLRNLKHQKELEYQSALTEYKKSGNVDINKFNRDYGIKGKRAEHFNNEIHANFLPNGLKNFDDLNKQYSDLERIVVPLNAGIDPQFASNATAIFHCFKHSDFGSEVLTPEKYFEIASELVNEPLNREKDQLTQEGDKNMITFEDPIRGAKGVVFETLAGGKQSLVTVHYDGRVLQK